MKELSEVKAQSNAVYEWKGKINVCQEDCVKICIYVCVRVGGVEL